LLKVLFKKYEKKKKNPKRVIFAMCRNKKKRKEGFGKISTRDLKRNFLRYLSVNLRWVYLKLF